MSTYIYSSAHHITWAGRRDSFRQVRAPSGCELVFDTIMNPLNIEVSCLSLRVFMDGILVSRVALLISHLLLMYQEPNYFSESASSTFNVATATTTSQLRSDILAFPLHARIYLPHCHLAKPNMVQSAISTVWAPFGVPTWA